MYRELLTIAAAGFLALSTAAEEAPASAFSPDRAVHSAWQGEKEKAPNPSYLGVYVRSVLPERVAELKLKEERGAEITMVDRDGPAGKAGLKQSDVILSFNDVPVENAQQFRHVIQKTPAGTEISLGISREGQPHNLSVRLGSRNEALAKRALSARPAVPSMDVPAVSIIQHSRRNGLVVENLTPQLAEYFGVKNGEGVLVRSVEKGSPADSAGFAAGDVVTRFAEERIDNVGDWGRLLRQHEGKTVTVTVLRERKQRTISLTIPAAGSGGSASLDSLEDYLASLGEEIEREVDRTLRSEEMREFLKLKRDEAADHIRQEIARLRPELERALRDMREKINEALEKHRQQIEKDMENKSPETPEPIRKQL